MVGIGLVESNTIFLFTVINIHFYLLKTTKIPTTITTTIMIIKIITTTTIIISKAAVTRKVPTSEPL